MRPLPEIVFLVVNSRCNLRCRMCDIGRRNRQGQFYRTMNRDGEELAPERIYTLVDDLVQAPGGPVKIALTGTEPLLYEDLEAVCAYILRAGLPLQITTNGWLLADFASFLVKTGLTELWVSLDGPAAVHDRIRGRDGAFGRAMAGLLAVARLKTAQAARQPKVAVNCTISELNQAHLAAFAEELAAAPVTIDKLTFCHTNFVTTAMAERHNRQWGGRFPVRPSCVSAFDPLKIDPQLVWAQMQRIKAMALPVAFVPELASQAMVARYYHHLDKPVTDNGCKMAWRHAQVLADGTVTVSTRCFDVALGHLDRQSLPALWNGAEREAFLQTIARQGAMPACLRCCGVF